MAESVSALLSRSWPTLIFQPTSRRNLHLHKTNSSCLSIILFKSWRPLFHHWHNIFSRSQCIYNIYKWLVKAQHSGKMDQLLSRGRSAGLLHVIQTESPAKGKLREAGGSFWNFCFEIIFTCCWLRLGWNCPPENPCGHKCWKALRNLENRKYDALIWKWQLAKTYWKQALEWRWMEWWPSWTPGWFLTFWQTRFQFITSPPADV